MKVSVIVCTYNPDPELLRRTLESLVGQTVRDFELVIVDNNSSPALQEEDLRRQYSLNLRVLVEPRQGITPSRCRAIEACSGDLLVFVDDDNEPDPDYVEQAIRIAEREPLIGHFGGITRARLVHPIPDWKAKLLPYLGVRNYGGTPITSIEPRWGKWEPIGAGMVTRRAVALRFVDMVSQHESSTLLGRRGRSLMSGEDSLMARAAIGLGFACSYQPALKLTHFMKPSRLRAFILARTIEGHGRSFVILERLMGRPVARPTLGWIARELVLRYFYRVRTEGVGAGTLSWFWDVGYVRQARMPE